MNTIFYVQRAIIECNCLTDGTGDSSRGTPKSLKSFSGGLVKGGTPQGTKTLVPEKCLQNLCICYLY